MKRLISAFTAATLILSTNSLCLAADGGVYEYNSDAEKEYVENILDNYDGSKFTTDVFEGNPTYLLEENFLENGNELINSECMPAGWDVDRSNGRVMSNGTYVCMMDGDPNGDVSMTHELMKHYSGKITLETSFVMIHYCHDGFNISMSGKGGTAFKLVTKGDKIGYETDKGTFVAVSNYKADEIVTVKIVADMDTKTVDYTVNDKTLLNAPFYGNPEYIGELKYSTGNEGEMVVGLRFAHVYVNYIVNERFLTSGTGKTPYDWNLNEEKISDTGVYELYSQRVDKTSYKLKTSSILERPVLSKKFECDADEFVADFYMMIPEKYDGIAMNLKCETSNTLTISVDGDNFAVNGETLYKNFVENLWYRFKIIVNQKENKADIYLNFNLVAKDVPLEKTKKVDEISFSTGSQKGAILWVDDILIYENLPLPKGYPTEPQKPDKKDEYSTGMLMYSMWREGFHFGWDRMSPYEERTPYLGFYTEGMAETADWETKWLIENGIDFQIFPFCGIDSTELTPIKKPIRGQALIDGFFVGQYQMDFCIMWSNPTAKTIKGLQDFEDNILPFWIEYYFKNPNYKTIDNKLLVYSYNTIKIVEYLGGEESFKTALELLDNAAKDLGYDGVVFVSSEHLSTDEAEKYGLAQYRYSWGSSADNSNAVITSTNEVMNSDYKGYSPSICQGFNTTPWRVGTAGFMSPDDVQKMVDNVLDNQEEWKKNGNEYANLITLTCWNEWGEGHFFAPSKLYGFSYLNIFRNAFTNDGVLYDQSLPSEESFLRMNVLYPVGRQGLKLPDDQVKPLDYDDLYLMQRLDFSTSEDYGRLEIEKSVSSIEQKDNMLVGYADAVDPSVFINDLSIDATKVKQIKLRGYQETPGSFTLYYQTTEDTNMGVSGKRFVGSMAGSGISEITLTPYDTKKLVGNITRMRIDPDDNVMGEFRVESIEIYGSDQNDVKVIIDGSEFKNNTKVRMVDDTAYMSVYRYMYVNQKAYVTWNRPQGRLHIDYNGDSFDFYDNDKKYTVNNMTKEFKNAPFYDDGNFFVPVRDFFEMLGYTVGWDDEQSAITLESPVYQNVKKAGTNDKPVWNFNIDGYTEGWTINNRSMKTVVKDGVMRCSARLNPVTMQITGLNIDTKEYNYAIIRIKNNTDTNTGRLYFLNESNKEFGAATRYMINLSSNDKKIKEYVINLHDNSNYSGTITDLRFDVPANSGAFYIDSIKLVKDI